MQLRGGNFWHVLCSDDLENRGEPGLKRGHRSGGSGGGRSGGGGGPKMSQKIKKSFRHKFSIRTARRNFQYRYPIRPFISSSFTDFAQERDYLMKKIFPTLDQTVKSRGSSFAPVDLRWGINDEQAKDGKVIQLCLDYITESAPYFICLLGNKYGSHRSPDFADIPKEWPDDDECESMHWLDWNYLVGGKFHPWILEDGYQNLSITELEIIQSAEQLKNEHCFFYFRVNEAADKLIDKTEWDATSEAIMKRQVEETGETRYAQEQLLKLKKKIKNGPYPVQFFRTKEELGRCILSDWNRVVDKMYPPLIDQVDQNGDHYVEWAIQEAYAESKRRVFVATAEIKKLHERMTSFAEGCLDIGHPAIRHRLSATGSHAILDPVLEPQGKGPPLLDPGGNHGYNNNISGNNNNNNNKAETSSQSSPKRILLLVGERGSGKTSIVANWAKDFQTEANKKGIKFFSHYVGASALSADISAFMRRAIMDLRADAQNPTQNALNDGDGIDLSDFFNLYETLNATTSQQRCVLMVAGINEFTHSIRGATDDQIGDLTWLPREISSTCKLILTTVESDSTYKSLSKRSDVEILRVPSLANEEDRKQLITKHLKVHCKCLNDSQISRLVNCKLANYPLFLSVVANELRVCGVFDRLDEQLNRYVDVPSITELWIEIIRRWTRDYGWDRDKKLIGGGFGQSGSSFRHSSSRSPGTESTTGWVADALRLIAVSRSGLSKEEILGCLERLGYDGQSKVTELDWAIFRSAAGEALFEKPQGLLTFHHQHLQEAIDYILLGFFSQPNRVPMKSYARRATHMEIKEKFHCYLANYFMNQPHSARRSEELPWQLEMVGDHGALAQVLADPNVFLEFWHDESQSRRLDMLRYWKVLSDPNVGKNPGHYYRSMMETVTQFLSESEKSSPGPSTPGGSEDEADQQSSPLRKASLQRSEATEDDEFNPDAPVGSLRSTPLPSTNRLAPSSSASVYGSTLKAFDASSSDSGAGSTFSGSSSSGASVGGVVSASSAPGFPVEVSVAAPSFAGDVEDFDHFPSMKHLPKQESSTDIDIVLTALTLIPQTQVALLGCLAGQLLSQLGLFGDAESLLTQAYQHMKTCSPLSQDEKTINCQIQESMADLYAYMFKTTAAEHWYNEALRTVESIASAGDEAFDSKVIDEYRGRLLDHIGKIKLQDSRLRADEGRAALDELREVEKKLEEAMRCMTRAESQTGMAGVHHNMALLRWRQKRFSESEDHFTESIDRRMQWFGRSHPLVIDVQHDLARLLADKANPKQDQHCAEAFFRKCIDVRERCLGHDHLHLAETCFELGKLLIQMNGKIPPKPLSISIPGLEQLVQHVTESGTPEERMGEARALLQRALDIRTKSLGAGHACAMAVSRYLLDVDRLLTSRHRPRQQRSSRSSPTTNALIPRYGRHSPLASHSTPVDADISRRRLTPPHFTDYASASEFQRKPRSSTAPPAPIGSLASPPPSSKSNHLQTQLEMMRLPLEDGEKEFIRYVENNVGGPTLSTEKCVTNLQMRQSYTLPNQLTPSRLTTTNRSFSCEDPSPHFPDADEPLHPPTSTPPTREHSDSELSKGSSSEPRGLQAESRNDSFNGSEEMFSSTTEDDDVDSGGAAGGASARRRGKRRDRLKRIVKKGLGLIMPDQFESGVGVGKPVHKSRSAGDVNKISKISPLVFRRESGAFQAATSGLSSGAVTPTVRFDATTPSSPETPEDEHGGFEDPMRGRPKALRGPRGNKPNPSLNHSTSPQPLSPPSTPSPNRLPPSRPTISPSPLNLSRASPSRSLPSGHSSPQPLPHPNPVHGASSDIAWLTSRGVVDRDPAPPSNFVEARDRKREARRTSAGADENGADFYVDATTPTNAPLATPTPGRGAFFFIADDESAAAPPSPTRQQYRSPQQRQQLSPQPQHQQRLRSPFAHQPIGTDSFGSAVFDVKAKEINDYSYTLQQVSPKILTTHHHQRSSSSPVVMTSSSARRCSAPGHNPDSFSVSEISRPRFSSSASSDFLAQPADYSPKTARLRSVTTGDVSSDHPSEYSAVGYAHLIQTQSGLAHAARSSATQPSLSSSYFVQSPPSANAPFSANQQQFIMKPPIFLPNQQPPPPQTYRPSDRTLSPPYSMTNQTHVALPYLPANQPYPTANQTTSFQTSPFSANQTTGFPSSAFSANQTTDPRSTPNNQQILHIHSYEPLKSASYPLRPR